ncbi:MAG: glutathione peroxidase [Pseudomonadales bacterium]|nr:glutathione peroxidase [Pseudomonadales bacterium]
MSEHIYDFVSKTLTGGDKSLSDYKGKVMLVVNTASQCGLTPQYKGLETLYQDYKHQGLEVLGYPCNQFGGQEPGGDSEISKFCEVKYGVSFQMFSKIDVNGGAADPVFKYLKKQAPGVLMSEKIKWNFTKFLVGRDGHVIKRFAPTAVPDKLTRDIEKALG